MSYSLVRKSLELLEYETEINTDKKKKKKRQQNGVFDLIPAHQRILQTSQTSKVISKSKKSSHKHKLSEKAENSVQDNVERLLLLSNHNIDEKTAEKLFNRAVKRQPEGSQVIKKKQEPTVFTAEDFKILEATEFD